MTLKYVRPEISKFKIIDGEYAWEEVVYSARMSGVPESVTNEQIFKMIIDNDYVIIKFDLKMSKGNAPEFLEHRMVSHSGYSTR